MSNGTPTVYLLWAILSSLVSALRVKRVLDFLFTILQFSVFLVCHLWGYDRLQCLRWNAGRQPGAFRRFMTVS